MLLRKKIIADMRSGAVLKQLYKDGYNYLNDKKVRYETINALYRNGIIKATSTDTTHHQYTLTEHGNKVDIT